jgi:hypothetical protein
MVSRTIVLAALLGTGGLLGAARTQTPPQTQAEADRMVQKLTTILETGERKRPKTAPPVETVFTDREANAYFRHYGPMFLPTGVVNPVVTIGERGRVTARATVSLDAVRKARERGWLDPLAYATGSLDVTAAGSVLGSNGVGVFQFESASLGGVSISKALLQELVRFYTTSPDLPTGFDLDKPFDLPSGIRTLRSAPGTAIIVQ